jgi:hypothetical protein
MTADVSQCETYSSVQIHHHEQGLSFVETHQDKLHALACNALDPNPYYTPRLLQAMSRYIASSRSVQCLAITQHDILTGFLPYTLKGSWFGYKRIPTALINPFIMSSLPLIAPEHSEQIADKLIKGLHTIHKGMWRFPFLSTNRSVAQHLKAACERAGFAWHAFNGYDRAVLKSYDPQTGARRSDPDAYFEQYVSKRRRKDLKRTRNNLRQAGELKHILLTSPDDIMRGYEAYVAMEMRGWKGQWGSALGCQDSTRRLGEQFFARTQNGPQVRIDMLTLNDAPIAISLTLITQRSSFGVKTTYDERFARFSPGLLLEEDMIRDFLITGYADHLDSASLSGCVVEGLWADREEVADVIIVTDPAMSSSTFQRIMYAEHLRLEGYNHLKRLYHSIRSPKQPIRAVPKAESD